LASLPDFFEALAESLMVQIDTAVERVEQAANSNDLPYRRLAFMGDRFLDIKINPLSIKGYGVPF
jgi:hypothetical protein